MLLLERPSLLSIAEVAQPELRLAGLRINPRPNGRSRTRYLTGIRVKLIRAQPAEPIEGLPPGARIGVVRWSPNGRKIAFSVTRETGIELWVADVTTRRATRLTPPRLNEAYGSGFEWVSDSRTLICRLTPAERGQPPAAPQVPRGPNVQESLGRTAPVRTYQDLLARSHDEAVFDHYLAARVVKVILDGKAAPIGPAGMITRAQPSPCRGLRPGPAHIKRVGE